MRSWQVKLAAAFRRRTLRNASGKKNVKAHLPKANFQFCGVPVWVFASYSVTFLSSLGSERRFDRDWWREMQFGHGLWPREDLGRQNDLPKPAQGMWKHWNAAGWFPVVVFFCLQNGSLIFQLAHRNVTRLYCSLLVSKGIGHDWKAYDF